MNSNTNKTPKHNNKKIIKSWKAKKKKKKLVQIQDEYWIWVLSPNIDTTNPCEFGKYID